MPVDTSDKEMTKAMASDVGRSEPKPGSSEEINLLEIWRALWKGKWTIIAIAVVSAVGSVLLALSLPNIYKSEALLVPSEAAQGGGISRMAGQLGGLASLAGINFNAAGGASKISVAIAVLKSRDFITSFIGRHEILPELIAVKSWDRIGNRLEFDPDLYHEEESRWVRNVNPPMEPAPSNWEAYEAFREILTVNEDKETGFVTIALEHPSPYVAKRWVELLVKDVNAAMKEKDVREAQQSIEFLHGQLSKIPLADMRTVFYQLIEEQTKTIMLANVREEYVFSTIDPPVIAEKKERPKRALISILGVIIGGMVGVGIVLIRHFMTRKDLAP